MAALLWFKPAGKGALPSTSMFFAQRRGVDSIYVLGVKEPIKRIQAYERIVKALLERVAQIQPCNLRVEHSHESRKIVKDILPVYPGLRMPTGFLPVTSVADILADQQALCGELKHEDVLKLFSQAVYGSEHMLSDVSEAKKVFFTEWEVAGKDNDEPLGERISPLGDIYRINLRPAREIGIDPERLWGAVDESSRMFDENLPIRKRKIEAQIETIGLEFRDIPKEPSSHSEWYKKCAAPSYRLIHGSLFRDLIRD